MTAPYSWVLGLSAAIFAIGVAGVLLRRNVLVMFMSIELMLNAVNLAFIALARRMGSMDGQVIVFFVMTVAAALMVAELFVFITHMHLTLGRAVPVAHGYGQIDLLAATLFGNYLIAFEVTSILLLVAVVGAVAVARRAAPAAAVSETRSGASS